MQFFDDLLQGMLKQRREFNASSGKEKINDFVDVMNEMIEKCETDPEYKRLEITKTTVMGQAMIFLLVRMYC